MRCHAVSVIRKHFQAPHSPTQAIQSGAAARWHGDLHRHGRRRKAAENVANRPETAPKRAVFGPFGSTRRTSRGAWCAPEAHPLVENRRSVPQASKRGSEAVGPPVPKAFPWRFTSFRHVFEVFASVSDLFLDPKSGFSGSRAHCPRRKPFSPTCSALCHA